MSTIPGPKGNAHPWKLTLECLLYARRCSLGLAPWPFNPEIPEGAGGILSFYCRVNCEAWKLRQLVTTKEKQVTVIISKVGILSKRKSLACVL